MFKFSDIPTDSQYKFKAVTFALLTGISIGCIAFLLYTAEPPEYVEDYAEYNATFEKINIIDYRLSKIDSAIDSLYETKSIDTLEFKRNNELQSKLIDWAFELGKERLSLEFKQIDKSKIIDEHDYRFTLKIVFYLALLLAFTFCTLQTTKGFKEWHKYLQRYQDAILMKEAGVSQKKIDDYLSDEKKDENKPKKKGLTKRIF